MLPNVVGTIINNTLQRRKLRQREVKVVTGGGRKQEVIIEEGRASESSVDLPSHKKSRSNCRIYQQCNPHPSLSSPETLVFLRPAKTKGRETR